MAGLYFHGVSRDLVSGTSAMAMVIGASALFAAPALAQEGAAPARAVFLEDIVVTARKVSENMQEVPVAITAFTAEALEQQNAVSLIDIQRLTPSLLMRPGTLSPASLTFTIRGQVNIDTLAAVDPSVGVYIDGVYIARAYGIDANLLDVQSVQVLKGPQGTLFGRNTTGGAILLQTNDPVLDETSAKISGTFGRFEYKSVSAVVNVPLEKDKVAVRAAGEWADSKGYHRELTSGERMGEKDHWNARLKLLVKPTESVSVMLMADGYGHKGNSLPWHPFYFAPTWGNAALTAGNFQLGQTDCFADLDACRAVGFEYLDEALAAAQGDRRRTALTMPNPVEVDTRSFIGTVSVDTGFGEVKFINGYRTIKNYNCQDMDGVSAPIYALCSGQRLKQYSTELQATGKAFSDRVDFAVGAFYFSESGYDQSFGQAFGPPLNPSYLVYYGNVDNTSVGVYGQANIHITDRLTFTGGLRWSEDKKGITINNGARLGADATIFDPLLGFDLNPPLPPGVTFRCDLDSCPDYRKDKFDGVSYTIGFDYKFSDDVMGYVKTARGFRSGGQNLRATKAAGDVNPFVPFKPEVATSYEAGVKSDMFGDRVRLNLAGYYIDMKNLQRRSIVNVNNTPTTVLGNARKAEIYGGEAEANVLFGNGFQLAGSLAYVHPKYKDYTNPFTEWDRRGDRFDGVARWQYSVSGIYEQDFDIGRLLLRADWAWLGKFALNDLGVYIDENGVARSTSDGSAFPTVDIGRDTLRALTSNSGGMLNLRASMSFDNDRYEVAVWGRNVLNNRRPVAGTYLNTIAVSGNLTEPATYGVTVTANF